MAEIEDLHNFDIQNAQVNLWVFKKSTSGQPPQLKFNAHWVSLSENVIAKLKETATQCRLAMTETIEYGLLAQNNEGSALRVPLIETHADKIIAESLDQTPAKRVAEMKKMQNAAFYAVKISSPAGNLYCVKKTDDSWKTKKRNGAINTLFRANILEIDDSPTFNLAKVFDFFILNDSLFISNKRHFESILNHKAAHENDFIELLAEPAFQQVFTGVEEVRTYVGNNAIQLRRASAIRQKQNYLDPVFMQNLRAEYANFGLNINFAPGGQITPSPETCPDIFKALLDHRLKSHFSGRIYDVQNTESITPP
nr:MULTISPECIES: Kiwa anti-phage protein KwaB-like domain-containing protein [unclassified Pseudomonas]